MRAGRRTLIECGVIRTRPSERCRLACATSIDGVAELIARHSARRLVAVEDVFYARNVRTTVVLGHARGVILLAGEMAGVADRGVPPAEIKKAIVGTGRGDQGAGAVHGAQLLRLKSPPQPADAADGVAAALCALLSPPLPSIASLTLSARRR